VTPALAELAKKVELLESEVDDLTRNVDSLREDNAFLTRLIEDSPGRRPLPPASGT
jgi:chaperonin cofactor prefoldin